MLNQEPSHEHSQLQARAVKKAAEEIGRRMLQIQMDEARTGEFTVDTDIDLTDDHRTTIRRTTLYRQLEALASKAYVQKGMDGAVRVLSTASEFHWASGMPYRDLDHPILGVPQIKGQALSQRRRAAISQAVVKTESDA